MAKVFQIPKRRREPGTGKIVPVMDAETGKPVMKPHWHARIEDWQGKRRNVKLSKSKAEAQRQADILEARQLEIKAGLRPIPTAEKKAAKRPFTDVIEEYLQWGSMQGGLRGGPWSDSHAKDRRSILTWWGKEEHWKVLSDLDGTLPDVEKSLRTLAVTGRNHPNKKNKAGSESRPLAGKTLHEYANALKAFCNWCVERKYLTANPVAGLGGFDKAPQTIRRALTSHELMALLNAAPPYLRLLLETALCTGLRRGELRALTIAHLNPEHMMLRIDRKTDKGRKLRQQRLPKRLCEPLLQFAQSGEPQYLYEKHYRRSGGIGCELAIPDNPLLFVPTHAARTLKRIAKRAGIPEVTIDGKLDFHGLRTSYINMLIESGADAKTVQELSRHDTASMTFDVYARAKQDKMAEAAEAVGDMIPGVRDHTTPTQGNGTA